MSVLSKVKRWFVGSPESDDAKPRLGTAPLTA